MSRAVVAVVALAVLIVSPGVATAVVDVLDGGQDLPDATVSDAAVDASAETASGDASAETASAASDDAAAQDDGAVDVTTGSQLSTVLSTTEDEVGTEVSQSAFDSRFGAANETERARLLADRAAAVSEEASAVAADYSEATAAYRNGSIDRSTYAQRLATLNARSASIESDISHVRDRAATVSDLALATAGYDESALEEAVRDLDSVASPGTAAIHQRFTGQSNGSVAVASADGAGVSIETESEVGERSREVRQDGDDDANLTVGADEALATARAALSDDEWTLRKTSVDADDGVYEFEFGLATANETGEAEVVVDGSAGTVTSLEEEIEAREADDEESDDEDGPPLTLVVTDGEPAPGATVTLEARQGGSPVSNVTVFADGAPVGTTDADGQIDVTLGVGETELEAEHGGRDTELTFEFEDDERDRPVDDLNVTAGLDGDTVTVTVTYAGDGVPGAQVSADGDRVGPTGPDGTVSFTYDGTGDLELEITRGQLAVERTYHVENGTLVRGESDDDSEDEKDAENETDEEDPELTLSVVEGEPAPDATVTLEATVDESPVAGVQVFVDDDRVGPTGPDGRIEVTLSGTETEIEAERGNLDAELEFEFEDDDSEENETEDESEENETDDEDSELALAVVEGEPAPNATVTLEATVDGEPTPDVQVFVDGDRAGSTESDGRIEVTLPGDETEVEAERGDLDAELEFEFDGDEQEGDEDDEDEDEDADD